MPALLWGMVSWLLKEVVIKFVVFSAVFALVAVFVPLAIGFLTPFVSTSGLSGVFSAIPGGMWFFLDFFALDFGVPLLISAHIARFLIRRLPVIG